MERNLFTNIINSSSLYNKRVNEVAAVFSTTADVQNNMSSSSSSESDDYEDTDQLGKLEKLKSLRDQFNCEIQEERREFICQLRPLIINWTDELPNLHDIFRPVDIDWLLEESVRSNARFFESETTPFVQFVIDTGFKDEPKFDEDGKPLLRRTTPLHHAFNGQIIGSQRLRARIERGFTRTPLHCALQRQGEHREEVVELLLRSGADPNMVDKWGSTPLHVICQGKYEDDLVKFFFKVNDELKQKVLVDVRNHEGLTPLQLAVSNLLPDVVDVLLDRGADLTSFVFPTASVFAEKFGYYKIPGWFTNEYKLRMASGALIIVERLEKRGYVMGRDDALTIMHFFAEYELFKEPEYFDEGWFSDEAFAKEAKKILIIPTKLIDELGHDGEEVVRNPEESLERPSLSLYDLIRLHPEEAAKRLAYTDYFELWRPSKLWGLRQDSREACTTHLCEILTRGFFRRWALDPFMQLTRNQLPILCCDIIVKKLVNEDLFRVCLAAGGKTKGGSNEAK
ncbi:unnamed protein product [Trichogramma brassicae]|uniref:Uncharacterized protein n=1 Tax=Trichogramma brassicae TaxID=86971 RepID=A0A6H5J0Z3_9HYME|nr:unnamed protein product [Trichogramma brassicae]